MEMESYSARSSDDDVDMDILTACSLGNEAFARQILTDGQTDVNAENGARWTSLMYACWGGYHSLVLYLLHCGASPLKLNAEYQSALHLATKSGCLQTVLLVLQQCILNHRDKYGKTALHYAVEFGYQDITNYLLKQGADPNISFSNEDNTPLMIAAMTGHRYLVELLLTHGAHRHPRNKQGYSAQQLAAQHGHYDLAQLLDTSPQECNDLRSFLESLSLGKYWPTFDKQGLTLQKFLNLNEDDLKSLGIKLLGPRRKMALAIASFKR